MSITPKQKRRKKPVNRYEDINDLPEKYRKQAERKLGKTKGPVQLDERKKAKRSKYGSHTSTINNIKFDSKKEGRRYLVLMDKLKNGEISDLRLQTQFTLIEGFKTATGETVKPEKYIADFTYINELGELVVEDVKSDATRKKESYRIKKKQMVDTFGIVISEV